MDLVTAWFFISTKLVIFIWRFLICNGSKTSIILSSRYLCKIVELIFISKWHTDVVKKFSVNLNHSAMLSYQNIAKLSVTAAWKCVKMKEFLSHVPNANGSITVIKLAKKEHGSLTTNWNANIFKNKMYFQRI